jgi:hypothetical protein
MRNLCTTLLTAFLLGAAGCGSDEPVARTSERTVVTVDTASTPEPDAPPSNWDLAAGSVLLVAGDQPDQVLVIAPDVAGDIEQGSLDVTDLVGAPASLIGRTGSVATVALGQEIEAGAGTTCNSWPVLAAPAGSSPWSVGFLEASVVAIPLDSVQAMSGGDSLALVSRIARLASALESTRTGPQAESFRGLPFVVQDVRLFVEDSVGVAAADVVRRVNQEASPLEERTHLILERRPGGEWEVARAERWVGREESVDRKELLAAVRLRGEPVLVYVHDTGAKVHYIMQWRDGGRWAKRWDSAVSRC